MLIVYCLFYPTRVQVHKGMGMSQAHIALLECGERSLSGWIFCQQDDALVPPLLLSCFVGSGHWCHRSAWGYAQVTSPFQGPLRYLIFISSPLTCKNETKDKKSVSDRHWTSGEKVWCPQADVQTNAFKTGAGVTEPWEMSVDTNSHEVKRWQAGKQWPHSNQQGQWRIYMQEVIYF